MSNQKLTEHQIQLIQDSWDFVITNTTEAGEIFYSNLFADAPFMRSLFSTNIEEQASKLVSLITFAVSKLSSLDDIIRDVEMLGIRHNSYGVVDKHYDLVGKALIKTLQQANGNKWNYNLQNAWIQLYTVLSTIMKNAASKAAV